MNDYTKTITNFNNFLQREELDLCMIVESSNEEVAIRILKGLSQKRPNFNIILVVNHLTWIESFQDGFIKETVSIIN